MKNTSPYAITISRQFGSGGAYIGRHLAKKLNIFYADREIIKEASKKLLISEEVLKSHDEKISSIWKSYIESYVPLTTGLYTPPEFIVPTDSTIFKAELEIIKGIAEKHSAVIMGRGSFYILREHPNHVNILLYSDVSSRKRRIQNLYSVSEAEAEKMILKSDKERGHYIHSFTGKEWLDPRQYDICIDTGRIGLDKSIDLILKYLDLM